jgi:autotransporter-associated beta strand protein
LIVTAGAFNMGGFSETINGLSGTGTVDGVSGTPTLTVGDNNATGADNTFSGVIKNTAGTLALSKIGSGTLTLSGTNTYGGATTISGGTLLVNGNQSTATGIVTVDSSGTLGGTGTLGGATTVNGNLAPGASVGQLTFTGGLTLGSLAANSLQFELGANTTAGTTYDTVATNTLAIGTLDFADFQFTDTGGMAAGAYTLISSGAPITGSIGTASGAIGAFAGTLSIAGNDLVLTVTSGGSPYTTWVNDFLPGNDVSNPAGDNDNDGLSNQEEFAFGLSPISGSSVNPILVQLSKTAGTFTYQRRAATGLTYKILTSTTLAAGSWTEDAVATAGQVATPSDSNETVVVTLTGAPLAAPKLFVRVAAE